MESPTFFGLNRTLVRWGAPHQRGSKKRGWMVLNGSVQEIFLSSKSLLFHSTFIHYFWSASYEPTPPPQMLQDPFPNSATLPLKASDPSPN